MNSKRPKKKAFLKIYNGMRVKTIVPFWLNTIHPPLAGSARVNSFEKIIKSLREKTQKVDSKIFKEWFISEDQFANELPLSRFLMIGNKIDVSTDLDEKFNNRFKEIFASDFEIEEHEIECGAGINDITTYYFSYGIGFVKISVDIVFLSKKLEPGIILHAQSTAERALLSFFLNEALPPFSVSEKFEDLFVEYFSKYSGNEPYKNWLLSSLDRENITLDPDFADNSFVELFVSGDDSEMGELLVSDAKSYAGLEDEMIDWSLEDDEENLDDQSISDEIDKWEEEWQHVYNKALVEGSSKKEATKLADETVYPDGDEIIDDIEQENDMETTSEDEELEETIDLYRDSTQVFDTEGLHTTTFNSRDAFLKNIGSDGISKEMPFSVIQTNESDSLFAFGKKNKKWQSGDPLISLRSLDENNEYREDDNFVPYFNFKTTAFECLQSANLGLYANLFKMDKTATLKAKDFAVENNGFFRARNLLDILRFETSYDIIRNEKYKIFHDCEKNNIDRVVAKNEQIFELIEQRLTGEKMKQEKNVSDAVSLGLAVISILTIGLAAADITNFLGFKDILGNIPKVLVITVPVIFFLLYLRGSIVRTKKLEKK
tara:strand:+ start:404 stop:2212 length:1809 start_codon:yes stop_codon:yes gene_type:complete